MTLDERLQKTFKSYLNLAREELGPRQAAQSNVIPFELLRNRSLELQRLVDGIEMRPEFEALTKQTLVTFAPEGFEEDPKEQAAARSIEIQNFFRRSRCYTSLSGGLDLDVGSLLEDFIGTLQNNEIKVRYLVALGGINFHADYDVLEFERFKIRRFSSEELKEVLQEDVNEVFYPGIGNSNLRAGEPYWFVDVLGYERRAVNDNGLSGNLKELQLVGALRNSASVQEEFKAFPKAVARVLDSFILYDWDSHDHYPSWEFNIPFILEISNDFREEPRKVPKILPMCGGDGEYDVDWDVELDNGQSDSFRYDISQMNSLLTRVRPYLEEKWRFLDVALLFFGFAFVSRGRQELFSYVTVLEALLGEQKESEGLMSVLKRRLVSVLAGSEPESKTIKGRFNDIYNLRSKLLHGDEKMLDQAMLDTDIRDARNLARRTLVWFLHYLDHVLEATRNESDLPNREELLSVLDFNVENRQRIKQLLSILPANHPSTWF